MLAGSIVEKIMSKPIILGIAGGTGAVRVLVETIRQHRSGIANFVRKQCVSDPMSPSRTK